MTTVTNEYLLLFKYCHPDYRASGSAAERFDFRSAASGGTVHNTRFKQFWARLL